MTPFTRVLRSDAPRTCHRSQTGDRDTRAEAGSTHRKPGVSIMRVVARSSVTHTHPHAPAPCTVQIRSPMQASTHRPTPLSP
jgi:hypothetical protein